MAETPIDNASARTDERRRMAERRAGEAARRAATARKNAELARNAGNERGAAVHDHEAAVHERAAELHREAARLQVQHSSELEAFAGRRGLDPTGLRLIAANVRRARDEAQARSEQARTFAMRARDRAETLRARESSGDADA